MRSGNRTSRLPPGRSVSRRRRIGQSFPIPDQRPRSADRRRSIRRDHRQNRRRRPHYPPQGRRPHRAGGQGVQHQVRFDRSAVGQCGDLPTARGQRARRGDPGSGRDGRSVAAVSRGARLRRALRHHHLRQGVDRGSLRHALPGGRAGVPCALRLSPGLARHRHSRRCHSRLADRHLRRDGADGLLAQPADPLRSGAGDRSGGRRCDRRRGSDGDEDGQGA